MSREEEEWDAPLGASSRPGSPLEPRRILTLTWRVKKWLLLGFCASGLFAVVLVKFVIPRDYEAVAVLRQDGEHDVGFREQQRELVALAAVADSDDFLLEFRQRAGLDDWSLTTLRNVVFTEADSRTGLITFRGHADSAETAGRRTNLLVTLFLNHHQARREGELRVERTSLKDRIAAASLELEAARKRYDAFRAGHGITNLTAEQAEVIGQTASLRAEADMARAEAESLEARIRQLEAALENTPRMASVSSGRSRESARVSEIEQQLREARAEGLGESHPMVRSLSSQVETLRASKGANSTQTSMHVNSTYARLEQNLSAARTEVEAVKKRHQSLEQLAQEAQARSKAFGAMEGEAAALASDVSVKEALIAELRRQTAVIDDGLRDVPSGFRIVNEARPPELPVASKKGMIIAVAVPLAFVLVLLGAFVGRELWGLRAFAPSEVAWWGNGPVVGTSTWPRLPGGWLDLVADVEDLFRDAHGTLLVVGVAHEESDLADQLVEELNDSWGETVMLERPTAGLLPGDTEPLDDVEDASYEGPDCETGYGSQDAYSGYGTHVSYDEAYRPQDSLPGYESFDEHGEFSADRRMISGDKEPDGRPSGLVCVTWDRSSGLQGLRRTARGVDAVLVVVLSGATKLTELAQVRERLGRDEGVAYLVVGASDEVARLRDRIGPVDGFLAGWAH